MERSHEHPATLPRVGAAGGARLPRELRPDPGTAGTDRVDEVTRTFREARRQASASCQRAAAAARAYARENPGAATLLALGVGLGAGCLLARRRSSAGGWREAAPTVAALAQSLLEVFDRRR
jgi:hypothetical protein